MNLEVVTFEAEHMIDIYVIDEMAARRAVAIERNMKEGGVAYAVLQDGKCIGAAGAIKDVDKYIVWLDATPELIKPSLWFHREVKKRWRAFKSQAVLPVQAMCDTSKPGNVRWLKALGFKESPIVVMEAK